MPLDRKKKLNPRYQRENHFWFSFGTQKRTSSQLRRQHRKHDLRIHLRPQPLDGGIGQREGAAGGIAPENIPRIQRQKATVLLLGPGGGLLQQAGHIAPELLGCRFPAGVLPVLKNLMQRDFMPLFEPGAQTALYGPVQWSGRLRTLLGMMQSAESEPESPGMIYLTLILHYVEQECRSEKQDIRPRNETVEQICAYLAANYQQKFSLTDVAARFYLSPYYLSRLFRRVTGQSIVDYINGRRIEAAQRLLESTDLNISAVAEQTGFASAAHFRRVFRETMGTGPLQYRKSHRG